MKAKSKTSAKAKTGPIEIAVIADRSGSMSSIVDDAIGGFNEFLAQQKKEKAPSNLTLLLFDTAFDYYCKNQPVKDVVPLDRTTFVPRGSTALNDAIGRTLADLEARAPAKAIICILTDGQENASREFTTAQVKEKIKAAEARGWNVVYLAANQDAFSVGMALGVSVQNTSNIQATGAGMRGFSASLSTATQNYAATGSATMSSTRKSASMQATYDAALKKQKVS
jgi:hypothetical protein